jgi:hypothetical protein
MGHGGTLMDYLERFARREDAGTSPWRERRGFERPGYSMLRAL